MFTFIFKSLDNRVNPADPARSSLTDIALLMAARLEDR